MNRILCTLFMASLFAVPGCGGGKKDGNGSNAGGPSAGAQVGIEIDVAALMKNPASQTALEQAPVPLPPFVEDISKAKVFVKLGDDFDPEDPTTMDFHASVEFSSAESAKAAFDMLLEGAPEPKEEEVNGTKYQVATSPDGMTMYFGTDGSNLTMGTPALIKHSTANYGTDAVNSGLSAVSGMEMKVALDLKSASTIVEGLTRNVPPSMSEQVAPFKAATLLTLGIGTGTGDNLLSLTINTSDEASAETIHETVNGLTAMAKMFGGTAVDADAMPASAEMLKHVLGSIGPKHDGTSVSITIPTPSNYDELVKKMQEEAKNMAPGFPGNNPGVPKGDQKDIGFGDKKK